MNLKAIEQEIIKEINSRDYTIKPHADWLTPSGNRRSSPMYEVEIENRYLNVNKLVKSKCLSELQDKARKQLEAWADQEIKTKINEAKSNKADKVELDNEKLKLERERLKTILSDTLKVDDKIDWEKMKDTSEFGEFSFVLERPVEPAKPIPNFFQRLFPILFNSKLAEYSGSLSIWKDKHEAWEVQKKHYQEKHVFEKENFLKNQTTHNQGVDQFKIRFEAGEAAAIIEYVNEVFERSEYPEDFFLEYFPNYEKESKTLVIDINFPSQDKISKILEYKYQKTSDKISEINMKDKEHDELYDQAIKQSVLRTAHEVFESIYTSHVESVVINAWVEYIDPSTGSDKVSCILSISTDRSKFELIRLDRIDVDSCIKNLKGIVAGSLSELVPVKPIMQLNKEDKRFVDSKNQLEALDDSVNLAEMHWEDFEHLIREVFSKMFSQEGSEVKVTQASSDGGVDAIAFDPDPIRGGKFVIQAKRYTKTVGVSAVRDLYGTMISEGAVKGILVSTATYGRDSREFVKDKPITLIDGSNLLYILEKQGYKSKIDLKQARAKLNSAI